MGIVFEESTSLANARLLAGTVYFIGLVSTGFEHDRFTDFNATGKIAVRICNNDSHVHLFWSDCDQTPSLGRFSGGRELKPSLD